MSEIEFPEYHEQSMGCGLEDQGIIDRYEACRYGYEQALEDVNNNVVKDLEKENAELREALKVEERIVKRVQRESKELHYFKSFVNMMIRRNLNHTCADYEVITAINEELIREGGEG